MYLQFESSVEMLGEDFEVVAKQRELIMLSYQINKSIVYYLNDMTCCEVPMLM